MNEIMSPDGTRERTSKYHFDRHEVDTDEQNADRS